MPSVNDTARAFMPYPDVPVAHAASGPLSGLSFAVKDLFHMAGYPTSGGQPLLLALNGIQTRTAPTVQRLLDAGARFVGKTITEELAFSMNGNNAHFGAPVNGGAPDRICGGSSSGSAAAVSNRLADVALGTDTGGSVRAPASHCGLVGLRPTQGRVSLQDCLDLSPSLDTCGWFTRDLATFGRVADVLLGADTQPLPAAVRLLLPSQLWALLAPAVATALAPLRARFESELGTARPVQVIPDSRDGANGSNITPLVPRPRRSLPTSPTALPRLGDELHVRGTSTPNSPSSLNHAARPFARLNFATAVSRAAARSGAEAAGSRTAWIIAPDSASTSKNGSRRPVTPSSIASCRGAVSEPIT